MYELETVVKRLKSAAVPEAVAAEPSFANVPSGPPPVARTRPAWLKVAATAERVAETGAPKPVMELKPVDATSRAARDDVTNNVEEIENDDMDGGGFGPVVTVIAAMASLALVVGVAIWTYKLGQRDAMEVPIVRAMTDPARVPPERPGGLVTPHQGMAVNAVMEGGGVRPVARSVVTAPGTEGVKDEDLAAGALKAQANEPVVAVPEADADAVGQATELAGVKPTTDAIPAPAPAPAPALERVIETPIPAETDQTATEVAGNGPAEKPVATGIFPKPDNSPVAPGGEAIVALKQEPPSLPLVETPVAPAVDIGTPVAEAQPETSPASDAAEPLLVAALAFPPQGEGSRYAPVVTEMTRPRPARLVVTADVNAAVNAAVAAAVAEADSRGTSTEVSASAAEPDLTKIPLPVGTRMVQLGAYESELVARSEWDRFLSLHRDLLGSKEFYVQRTETSGGTFFRVRVAGYASGSDTRAACAALEARGVPCLPVILR